MKRKIIQLSHIKEDQDLAQLIAALLSDGSVERGLLIKFVNKDFVLIKKFTNLVKKIFNLSSKDIGGDFKLKREQEVKKIYVCSVEIVEFLKKYTPNYRTKPYRDQNKNLISYPVAHIPNFIMEGSNKIKTSFLRMYASCDGCVELNIRYVTKENRYDVRGYITFLCQHPKILKQLFELLKTLNFNPIKKYDKIQLTKINEIHRFKETINFITNCKITSSNKRVYFYWRKKSDILDLLTSILEYGIPKDLSFCEKSNKNKEKIVNHLSNFLYKIENKNNFENCRYKKQYNLLTSKEKEWLKLRKELDFKNDVPYKFLSRLFLKRFSKPITPQGVFYYRRNK